MSHSYDVIIVGAGATGSCAADRLTAAGRRVLLLEAGPDRSEPEPDAPAETRSLWARLRLHGRALLRQPVQSHCYAWRNDPDGFVDDVRNPFSTPPSAPFLWLRSRQVGGRLTVKGHGRRFVRLTDREFAAIRGDRFPQDWPLREADLAPYYHALEAAMPPSPSSPSALGTWLTAGLRSADWPAQMEAAHLLPSFLDAARTTGRLTLRANCIASHLLFTPLSRRVCGVAGVDRGTGAPVEAFAPVVLLCASTIESTRLLLHTALHTRSGPGTQSGLLGHYLMDHVKTSLTGSIPRDRLPAGIHPQTRFYVAPRPDATSATGSFGVQIGVGASAPDSAGAPITFTAFGEMQPRFDNRVQLHPRTTDHWGVPVAHIDCRYGPDERRMQERQTTAMRAMAHALGVVPASIRVEAPPPGSAIHEVGTARMGRDPATSVCRPDLRLWDADNVFVLDGSCFVSQGYQNPTLTMMALAARACDALVGRSPVPAAVSTSSPVSPAPLPSRVPTGQTEMSPA